MSAEWTRLKGVNNIGDSLLNDQLVSNMVEFLSWGFLGIGSFYNVNRPTSSGHYGGAQYRLRLVNDPNYTMGQVWEGFRLNWVWESGVDYAYAPIPISGVYLNNSFVPISATGSNSYNINYPLGRVVFNTPIATNSRIELNYSYKYINVYDADAPGFKELQFNSFLIEGNFNNASSGVRSILGQNRIQLPAVIVEAVHRRAQRPYKHFFGRVVAQDILFHIFAETSFERGNLVDILTFQKEKKIMMFDKNAISSANAWPLNQFGSLASGALCYPDLLERYNGGDARFEDVTSQETGNLTPGFFNAIVRAKMEVYVPTI